MHSKNVLLVVGALLLSGVGVLLVSRGKSQSGADAPELAPSPPQTEPVRATGALDSADANAAAGDRAPAPNPAAASGDVAEIAAQYRDADAEALEVYRSDVERNLKRIRNTIGLERLRKGTCKHVKTQMGVPVDLGAAAKADVAERFPGRKAHDVVWSVSGSGSLEVVGIAEGENAEYDKLTRERDWISGRIELLGGVTFEGVKDCPLPSLPRSN